ncbi:MAG: hypothetical protein ACRDBG_04045 [Waterburya sp.]
MIKLNREQINALNSAELGSIVIADSYTDFPTMKMLGKDNFNKVLPLIGLPGNWDTYLASGNLQDLGKFREFLKTSVIYSTALKTGQSNPAVRKLVFELTFWVSSEVGEKSPNTILAVWQELNNITKGAIKAAVPAAEVAAWNKAIDDCMMLPGFKL